MDRITMPAMWRMSTALCLLLAGQALGPDAQTPAGVPYEAFAVRFGILPAFSVSGLVAGAARARRLDIPVMVWLLTGTNGRIK